MSVVQASGKDVVQFEVAESKDSAYAPCSRWTSLLESCMLSSNFAGVACTVFDIFSRVVTEDKKEGFFIACEHAFGLKMAKDGGDNLVSFIKEPHNRTWASRIELASNIVYVVQYASFVFAKRVSPFFKYSNAMLNIATVCAIGQFAYGGINKLWHLNKVGFKPIGPDEKGLKLPSSAEDYVKALKRVQYAKVTSSVAVLAYALFFVRNPMVRFGQGVYPGYLSGLSLLSTVAGVVASFFEKRSCEISNVLSCEGTRAKCVN